MGGLTRVCPKRSTCPLPQEVTIISQFFINMLVFSCKIGPRTITMQFKNIGTTASKIYILTDILEVMLIFRTLYMESFFMLHVFFPAILHVFFPAILHNPCCAFLYVTCSYYFSMSKSFQKSFSILLNLCFICVMTIQNYMFRFFCQLCAFCTTKWIISYVITHCFKLICWLSIHIRHEVQKSG